MKCFRVLALVLAVTALGADEPPLDVILLRIQGSWLKPPPELQLKTRIAAATAIMFQSNGTYVEHGFWVIEQADKSLNFSTGDGHVVTIGTWRRNGTRIIATREVVWRTGAILSNEEPLCTGPDLKFVVSSDYLRGGTIASGFIEYRRNAKLSRREFESYVSLAKKDGKTCATR